MAIVMKSIAFTRVKEESSMYSTFVFHLKIFHLLKSSHTYMYTQIH